MLKTTIGRLCCTMFLSVLALLPARAQQAYYSFQSNPTTPADYLASVSGACVGCAVLNPERAADLNQTNFATISTLLGLPASATTKLRLRLNGTAPAGYKAGVLVGSARILDLLTLNVTRVRTFLGNTVRETAVGANAIELNALGNDRYVLEFTTTLSFDRVELELRGLSDAVSTFDVYYAYGTAQSVTPLGANIYSSFSSPQNNAQYSTRTTGICVLCGVSNPARAADQTFTTANYATIQTTIGALGSTNLRLQLSSPAAAGSVAGVVIGTGSLLDVSLLNTLTIRTYGRDSNGNIVLRETAIGASLLQVNALSGNRYVLGFTTTQPYEFVEIGVGSLLTVANTVRVYYAFAAPGASSPLPVTLTRFDALAQADGTVRLTWQTAREQDNDGFEIERSSDGRDFQFIGRLDGHGSTTQAREYTFVDRQPTADSRVYYRLRQLDIDGPAHLSKVVTVLRDNSQPLLSLWPNPARDRLHLNVASRDTEPATLVMTDVMGRTVLMQSLAAGETEIGISHLPAGRYAVRLGVQVTSLLVE